MASRKEKCKWCKAKLLVPGDARTVSCPRCRGIINLEPTNPVVHPYVLLVSPPPAHGNKRAVICGVSYKNHPKRLDGSINDALSMRYFLVHRLGFPDASIIVLIEDEKDPSRFPTKMNIRRALRWLVHGCQAGDSLVFHYSGHGSKVLDLSGDEIDGKDEALVPVDYETEGRILDDEINATIVSPLPKGVTLHAIIDTCFSGTFLDLPFMCRMNWEGYFLWQDHRVPKTKCMGTKGGLAICISACDDHQTAFTGTANGALTYSFIQALENQPKLNYAQLLTALRNNILNIQRAMGVYGPLLQEPQLSASNKFDIHYKKFVL